MSNYNYDDLEELLTRPQNAPVRERAPQRRAPPAQVVPYDPNRAAVPRGDPDARAYGRDSAKQMIAGLTDTLGLQRKYKPMFPTEAQSEVGGDVPGMLLEDDEGGQFFMPYKGSQAAEGVRLGENADIGELQQMLAQLDAPPEAQSDISVAVGEPKIMPRIDVQVGRPTIDSDGADDPSRSFATKLAEDAARGREKATQPRRLRPRSNAARR